MGRGDVTTGLFDCDAGFARWESGWSAEKQAFCCNTIGRGCTTTPAGTALPETTPTVPPTPFPTQPPAPVGPVDPYNCAVGEYPGWDLGKQSWCCTHHHICGLPIEPPAPADPYNCADGFANWQAGWSVGKKEWCCRVHGK